MTKPGSKDTPFCQKTTLNFSGKLHIMDEPMTMGVLNITPDSFYKDSRVTDQNDILNRTGSMLNEGADMIDIGGYSSRPGALDVTMEEELTRVIPAIRSIHQHFPQAIISIDTYRAHVARVAIESGASLVNDISGGQLDPGMFDMIASLKVPYILMHMKGTPATMNKMTQYKDLLKDIAGFFSEGIDHLKQRGIADIILDPGIGFAKTIFQNFEILKNLTYFQIFGFPLMVGVSRKSLIYKTLNIGPEDALNGTTVLHTLALLNQASILRVHDVKATKEVINLMKIYLS
jgi:dihydropteroate synthase